eukprot:CAMPEP_0119052438 /NCGR_PEP_ID=MMETSP1177-20130426/73740_1 /TAXON_ID=2985 /ORGANISM="Ochromonas sp, Strain CCMP1899" /LENGTH=584 /DNA_ID=CAMNT_0007032011 /DNA_START=405 /DNA_END=2159 /DNA_ORIENTATION=-
MGATCFMSSVLQALLNNSVVLFSRQMQLSKNGLEPCSKGKQDAQKARNSSSSSVEGGVASDTGGEGGVATAANGSNAVSSNPCITDGCIACEFRHLFWDSMASVEPANGADTKSKGLSPIIPSNLLYSVWSHADYMAGYDQQDAHEFLIALLDGLGTHLETFHGEISNSFPRYSTPHDIPSSSGSNGNSNSRSNSLSNGNSSSTGNGNGQGQSRSNSISSEHPNAPSSSTLSRTHSHSQISLSIPEDSTISTPICSSSDLPNLQSQSHDSISQWSPRGLVSPRGDPRGGMGGNHTSPRSANKSNCFRGFVNEVFAGWMQSELHCMHCGHCSYKLEPFLDVSLSLDIPLTSPEIDESDTSKEPGRPKGRSKDDPLTLAQCLQHFTSLETLTEQVHCDKCLQHRPSKKRITLSMPPKVLILHFKRFDSLKQLKISSHVDLPLRGLDLSPFVQQQYRQQLERNHLFSSTGSGVPLSRSSSGIPNCRSSSNSSGNDPIPEEQCSGLDQGQNNSQLLYDLQGLVSHKGSLTQGHYVSYVAAMNGSTPSDTEPATWLRCDDDSVTPVSEDDVQNTEGYILFYVSRKSSMG